MQLSYTNVERFIKPVFSHLGVHQLLNLTLIVFWIDGWFIGTYGGTTNRRGAYHVKDYCYSRNHGH